MKITTPKQIDVSKLLWVGICEAKPNPMFTDEQRAIIRFLRYSRKVPCAACGKKKKTMWTMLCSFTAGDWEGSIAGVLKMFPETFDPLTPVCDEHPLGLPEAK